MSMPHAVNMLCLAALAIVNDKVVAGHGQEIGLIGPRLWRTDCPRRGMMHGLRSCHESKRKACERWTHSKAERSGMP